MSDRDWTAHCDRQEEIVNELYGEIEELQAQLAAERQNALAREQALDEARGLARLYAAKLAALAASRGDRTLREDLARDRAHWPWLALPH